jgi:GntR family transcriptional repressor for pyruvate dehydrogenase complex
VPLQPVMNHALGVRRRCGDTAYWKDIGCLGGFGMAVTDEAILKIKEMIVGGELKPGDRLPKEPELAARLGLSRNSLREAVKALSLMHVLDVRQGDGTYVTSLEPQLLLEAVNFVVDFHSDDSVLQFFEVRRILEPTATALAAVRASEDELKQLEKLLEQTGPEAPVDQLVASDLEFHRGIAEASGNNVLCSLLDGLTGATQRARIWRGLTEEGALERTLAEHRAILEALRSREPEVARSWATVHIAGVESWLRKAL